MPGLKGRAALGPPAPRQWIAAARAALVALKCVLRTRVSVYPPYEVIPLGKLAYPKEPLVTPGAMILVVPPYMYN